jgi:hypothetical protein
MLIIWKRPFPIGLERGCYREDPVQESLLPRTIISQPL